jgi:hypothetical protein
MSSSWRNKWKLPAKFESKLPPTERPQSVPGGIDWSKVCRSVIDNVRNKRSIARKRMEFVEKK